MVGMYLLTPSLAVVSVLSVVGSSSPLNQPESAPTPHAKPSLVAEHVAVRPSSKTWLGLTFDIDDHWHIYWDGDGDTGQPVKAEFTLPPGCKVGEIVWPTPKRQILAENILDYVYEGKVTLLVELETPESVEPGSVLKIAAQLKWMECSEECWPQTATVSLELPVTSNSDKPGKSRHAPRFEETRRRAPRSVEETARVVRSEWRGDTLLFSVPDAERLIFYPHRTSARLANALEQADVTKNRMELEIESDKTDRVIGILEVRRNDVHTKGGTKSEYFTIDQSRRGSGAESVSGTAEKATNESHK
jgi:DsbC/DsbD-like thiol-disulfide interchange protein